jgi:hypothetical protein
MGESREQGNAPSGWYPDPNGSGNLFYWDGKRWTGDVHGATAAKPAADRAPRSRVERGRIAVIGGGVAVAIAPFLPWVKVILLGNLNLFQLFNATGRSSAWAWVMLLVGVGTAAVAYRRPDPTTVRRLGLSVGLLGGVIAIVTLEKMLHELRDANGLATVGIGPYVAIAGCIAMVVGGAMSKRQAGEPAQASAG